MKKVTTLLVLILTVWGSLVTVPTNKVLAQRKVYRIAYITSFLQSSDGGSSPVYYLKIVDPDGKNEESTQLLYEVEQLLWSPDHTKLAVVPRCCDSFIDFYNESGNLIKRHDSTRLLYPYAGITWFGNSNEILGSYHDAGEGMAFFAYDLVKDSEYKVVSGSPFDTWNVSPVVSPDGKLLAFEHQEFKKNNWILVVKLDPSKYPYDYLDFHNGHVPGDYIALYGPDLYLDLRWLSDSDTLLANARSAYFTDLNYLLTVSSIKKSKLK